MNKEEKLNKFLEKLFNDTSPDYELLEKDKEFLEIVELSLLLKKHAKGKNTLFRTTLYKKLYTEFKKEFSSEKVHRSSKIAFGTMTLATALSIFFMLFRPAGTLYAPARFGENQKSDIVKVASYSFGNRKTLRILYNEKNRAILYWPIGQFAIFQ
jgi:hypothetical protein